MASNSAPGLLFSTVDGGRGQIPHHATPLTLLRRQADAVGLPLVEVELPSEVSDETYEDRMREAFAGPLAEVSEVAFGDLFLTDLRAYREARMAEVGRSASFPLWGRETDELARDFIRRFDATVCAVDSDQIPGARPGVPYDAKFLESLPEGADRCGERGEFHTFVHDGPLFSSPVKFVVEGTVESADGRFLHAQMTPVNRSDDAPDPTAGA